MMDEKNMENMHEEDELRPIPLTAREKFILGALIAVTSLWTILLCKALGWVVMWIKGMLG